MINVAILGFGVVGGGVYDVIEMNSNRLASRVGEEVRVKKILDLREFPGTPFENLITHDINDIINDDEITVVAECMGGSHPAFDYSLSIIKSGKHVVTSNKEVVSKFGSELIAAAAEHGVRYLFEASVGGGIPLIHPLCECMSVNLILKIAGILNGTTNYILTRMFGDGASFDSALSEAQQKGYAERNPSADIDGLDTARKICILSDLAYGITVLPEQITTEGIRTISSKDVADAEAYGATIKLIGYSEKAGEGIYCIVCPFFVQTDNVLSGVNDVFNAVKITGNAVGDVVFYGKGAGKLPTASAMVSDIAEAIIGSSCSVSWIEPDKTESDGYIKPISSRVAPMYLRFSSDKAGQEQILKAFASCEVVSRDEISSKERTISIVCAPASEDEIMKKVAELDRLYSVKLESKIRILA